MNNEQEQAERQAIIEKMSLECDATLTYMKEQSFQFCDSSEESKEMYMHGFAEALDYCSGMLSELRKPSESINQAIKSVLYDYSAETIQFADEISERIQKALFFSEPWPPKPVGITVAAVSCVPLKTPSENLVEEIVGKLCLESENILFNGENRRVVFEEYYPNAARIIANLAPFNPNAELLKVLKRVQGLSEDRGHPGLTIIADICKKAIENAKKQTK